MTVRDDETGALFCPDVLKQAGARFSVHSFDLEPILEDSGMDLQPNTMTQAAVQEVGAPTGVTTDGDNWVA